jgi:hypothetical protein
VFLTNKILSPRNELNATVWHEASVELYMIRSMPLTAHSKQMGHLVVILRMLSFLLNYV